MRLISLLLLFLSLHSHFAHSSIPEDLTRVLHERRIQKGITGNELKYDKELERLGRENTPYDDLWTPDGWDTIVSYFGNDNYCGILKGETEQKMDMNNTYSEAFYEGMINKIDQEFQHLLYDPSYEKMAVIFYHNRKVETTPFVIIFGVCKLLEDYVARHICFLRSEALNFKFQDQLAPISIKLLNQVAKCTTNKAQKIAKELTVVNIRIENHDQQSTAFKIMKSLDLLFTQPQPNPDKEKLLLPKAQRLGAYIKDPENLVIVIESIDADNVIADGVAYLQTKVALLKRDCIWFTKQPDQGLNKIAECIASGYGVAKNPPKDLAEKCRFDPDLYHGCFVQNTFNVSAYEEDQFQLKIIQSSMYTMFFNSQSALRDRNNIQFGIGFMLVWDDLRSHHFWNVFAIFQYTSGVSDK